MKQYGLIGKTLCHSFSKKYFTEKFAKESLDCKYDLYELPTIEDFETLIRDNELFGLNVTIPYKQDVMKYLDSVDKTAAEIGAVNTIKFVREGGSLKLKGYNTDVIGFGDSIRPLIKEYHKKALVLGTGGASLAICYALNQMGIEYKYVSRKERDGSFVYGDLNKDIMEEYLVIVNCSPVGTFPNCEDSPSIPYQYVSDKHLLYDLVYNPERTKFCRLGEEKEAVWKNGLEMLHGQAEASWRIWNE